MANNLLRPQKLEEFFGQESIIKKLKVYIYSANLRNAPLDHVLLFGPPGLGKTSLAQVIASEMNSKFLSVNGASIEKISDIIEILSQIEPGEVLFIDEIHRLSKEIEETLYSVLEDFTLNINYKNNERSKVISLDVSPFTFIGATTNPGELSLPLRNRFPINFKFIYYSIEDLFKIIKNNTFKLNINLNDEAVYEIAKRSRKTPRISNNILKRLVDYSCYHNLKKIDLKLIISFFDFIGIDSMGLDESDYQFLSILHFKYLDKPVSLESVAFCLNENPNTLKNLSEPYLLSINLIERTKSGRKITKEGIKIITKNMH